MQRRLGSSHGHQGEDDSAIAAAAFRQQQQRSQIQLQQQLHQLLAASSPAPGSGSSFNNSSLLSSSQQQQAAALALFSDMRAAALEAQLRQAVQLQQLNNHQQLLSQQQQQENLLLARALAGKNHAQLGLNLANPEHQQQLFAQNRQQQQHQAHPANLQELELRLLQEQKLIERQKQQQQQRATLLATVASEDPQDDQTNGTNEIAIEDGKNSPVTQPNGALASGIDRKEHQMKNIVREDIKTSSIWEATSENKISVPPGAILVPCRARGMPMDHNFKTAYFVIPNNIRHGDELRCSYLACYNSGIKFRYCTYCKIPVAKRNFRKRHNHGMSPSHIDGSDDDKINDFESDENESTGGNKPTLTKSSLTPTQKNQEQDTQSSASALVSLSNTAGKALVIDSPTCIENAVELTNSDSRRNDKESEKEQPVKDVSNHTDVPISNTSNVIIPSVSKDSLHVISSDVSKSSPPPSEEDIKGPSIQNRFCTIVDEKRKSRWAELLWERPSTGDNNAMSAWLLEVLSVSDFEKSPKEDVSSNITSSKSHKMKQSKGRMPVTDNKSNKSNKSSQQENGNTQMRSKPVKKRNSSNINQSSEHSHADFKNPPRPKTESSERKKIKVAK